MPAEAVRAPMVLRALLPAAAMAVLVAGLALADAGCVDVAGTFVNVAVPPPGCTSPVLFCTHGDLRGDFEGGYDFTMTTQTPDPAGPPVTADFTGESTITLDDGQMFAHDSGRITFRVVDPSPFETHVGIYDGTGPYAGATGHLLAEGQYDLVAGRGAGTYSGVLCVA